MTITSSDMERTAYDAVVAAETHFAENPVYSPHMINVVMLASQAAKDSGGQLPIVLYSIYLTTYATRYTALVCEAEAKHAEA